MDPLASAARHGPIVLIGGLLLGIVTPPEVNFVQDNIRVMVIVLLFLSVLRVDPRNLLGSLGNLRIVLGRVLGLQLLLPLLVIAIGAATGMAQSPMILALTLATAASAIVGSPNVCVMVGVEPVQSLRLLILGTVLLPLTILPVFWASAHLQGVETVLRASLVLLVTLGATISVAVALRLWLWQAPSPAALRRVDGLSALALALFVVGLMPEVRSTAMEAPFRALFWLSLAFVANWGAQIVTVERLARRTGREDTIATAVYAGNRNIALFLVALPEDLIGEIMAFIGCYQIPMYLTPLFLRAYVRKRLPDA